jgi:antitoxin component YwqK of YwqJK toxin-antitoxin module
MASSGEIGHGNYFRGGMRQGQWNLRDGSGNKAKGSYINNMRDGFWIQWYPNGQKKIEGIFHNDVENGPSTQWAPDGRKMWEGSYRDGQYHGKWKLWNEVGELSELEYMNGVRIR